MDISVTINSITATLDFRARRHIRNVRDKQKSPRYSRTVFLARREVTELADSHANRHTTIELHYLQSTE